MHFQQPRQILAKCYIDLLEGRIEEDQSLAKGERRKLKLLLAAAEILQEGGYHKMRIADILKKAKVARGTFYIYFQDKSDISLQVLSDFRGNMLSSRRVNMSGKDWRNKVYLSNLYFAEVYQMNTGLLQAFFQFVDEADDFRRMRNEKEREWVQHLFTAFLRSFDLNPTDVDRDSVLRRLHALRVMVERLCVQVYIEAMPEMTELFPTPHHVATTATELWVEALTAERSKYEGYWQINSARLKKSNS
ncbi:MAG: TetR/AcrR family transcriptional regulator [Alcanivoracaceae bacterium]|jgi:AcrR family transcriptional regulator|nr:TetR/AcrR family transcriptional regulator [Alcanivoracaceae bacterium]